MAIEQGLERRPVPRTRRREEEFVRRLGFAHDSMLLDEKEA
jgi:hypothetical protein